MIHITRKATFNAAHRLARPDWDDAKNFAVFGKCSNPNWHGHNYTLYVTLKGEINPETGFLVDLKWLKSVLEEVIIEKIDHKNINLEVPFMQGKLASTENLALAIWEELFPHIQKSEAQLHSVKVYETENNFAEYFG